MVLESMLEPIFDRDSFGYRPGRSALDAVALVRRRSWEYNWVVEFDIKTLFDSLDRTELLKMLEIRVADGSLLRLIRKCLCAGVLEGDSYSEPELGTVQGSALSPLLGNIYLHYVLDRWFERDVKPRLRGRATLIRYCDDFVIGFEHEDDARRVRDVLTRRMERFGLTLHPEKTRLLPFRRPSARAAAGKASATFDFLGFTLYHARTRQGGWAVHYKTKRASFRRAIQSVNDWCRSQRHLPVREQQAALNRRLRGHYAYFGVNGNYRSLTRFYEETRWSWFKWLCRRSQRSRLSSERFADLLGRLPLARPRIMVQIWG